MLLKPNIEGFAAAIETSKNVLACESLRIAEALHYSGRGR